VKQVVISLLALFLLVSCRSLKPVVAAGAIETAKNNSSSPVFIENIAAVTPGQKGIIKTAPATANEPAVAMDKEVAAAMEPIKRVSINEKAAIENSNSLQFKYSILLNVPVEQITNYRLLEFIEEWYGTRYLYGGSTRRGIDCSAFSGTLQATVFGRNLPRIAQDQFLYSERISRSRLQEGDLVFFNTRGGISHVGVYLANNKFVHASSSHGVIISDLTEAYYSRKFIAAGRVRSAGVTASGF
jgi:cell wall-associated NlpC family hydrolase